MAMARSDGRLRLAQWLAVAVPGALLLGALGSQVIGGLVPCEMCMWQRWPHLVALGFAALSFGALRQARPAVLIAALAIAVSGAIGVFHAGVEYGWWEGVTACSTTAAAGTLDAILHAPIVRCDVPQWTLAGISLAGFNAIISLAGGGWIAWMSTRTR